jgi:acetyl-CoA C-acetyltransferase
MMDSTNSPARPVYLVDGCRTPFLKARGVPGPFSAADLAVAAGRPLLARQPFPPQALDEVLLGCVAPGPDEANVARIVALRLGCGERMPAWTVQRNCGSGMQALDSAAASIAAGRADLVLAGGTESMSHAPVLWSKAMVEWLGRWARTPAFGRVRHLARLRAVHLAPVIGLLEGLRDPVVGLSMGQTAEELAWRLRISREAMDGYALRSHQRLGAARERGDFEREIVPIFDRDGQHYADDDGYRPESSLEKLARLKPAFDRPNGSVTAGNSAQVTDGAAWLILASEAAVERHGLPILARVHHAHWAALDPARMGLGPVHAAAPLLVRHGLLEQGVDLWEINEAFAAQVLACLAVWHDRSFSRKSSASPPPRRPSRRTASIPTAGPSPSATRWVPAVRASSCTSP